MKRRRYLFLLGLLLTTMAVAQKSDLRREDVQLLTDHVFNLSEVMLHDVANPPAASRFYAYALLGAYEASAMDHGTLPDLHLRWKMSTAAAPEKGNRAFCSLYSMLEVGRQLMPSGHLLEEKQKKLIQYFKTKRKLSNTQVASLVAYSEGIAAQVVAFARADHYNQLSTYSRYKPKKEEGHWFPTPPEYMAAVEPQWKTIVPFFLDSAMQFAPAQPTPYSKDTASSFYHQMKEVYVTGLHLTAEQRAIASFWDCNPFAVSYSGHMAIGLKKISPGGHWMGITGIACRQAGISLDSAILIHTAVALTLHDAFISCWQEKYKSDRIRPEAAINKLIDPAWRPLLQTPPFPEYTSGHSVVSAAVAVVLTRFFGDGFEYTDTSEIFFGLPERKFSSFQQAANEAAISRLYGGIHFRDACEQGMMQGRSVGEFVCGRMFGGK
ncbi:vanadium-dependent haloperoxidase [Chryseolinea soli]|uniref:Phosphatase PAP2 family protein n=1 Tax=Chryseolinea soli TaxID=2321403 RepID=A0A385SXB9_9BACT|nr:vanadium-dependent haloperoxidase [Chryseolinea soli]AYB34380.1 phosphatase PAP2 family protein [Chryseolinea soli]